MSDNGQKNIELPASIVVRDLAQTLEVSPIKDHQSFDGQWGYGNH